MATYTGQNGVLKMDNNSGSITAVAEVTSFTVDHTVNTIEDTAMGDQYRTYRIGVNEWSGSADIYFDSTHISSFGNVLVGNASGGLASDASASIELYPGGDTATYPKLSGEIIVTGFSVASEMEGMVTATISFQGTGALTMAAVSA
jgi:predicted secreted protein